MSNDDAGYYAIIPAGVRYDDKLTPSAKLLYGEITALCKKQGYCWATNEYFADLYKTSDKTIGRWIKTLKDRKYIYCKSKTFRYADGTIRKVRYIGLDKNVLSAVDKIVLDHTDKNVPNHTDKNVPYINTIMNNTKNEYLDTNVSKGDLAPVENSEPIRSQRSLEIDQAFVIWEEIMGYPLQPNKTDRRAIHNMLQRKDMDLGKLRMLVALVKKSQSDKYKRFTIADFTDLHYKQNELIAWAHEKATQQHTNSKLVDV